MSLAQSAQAQRCGPGRHLFLRRGEVAPRYFDLMLEIDDSELTEDEREFLKRWAKALQVTLAVLVLRILSAAVDGDQYIQGRPED